MTISLIDQLRELVLTQFNLRINLNPKESRAFACKEYRDWFVRYGKQTITLYLLFSEQTKDATTNTEQTNVRMNNDWMND